MKSIQNISARLERQLIRAFAMLDAWFDADDSESRHSRDLLESIIRQNRRLLERMSDEAPKAGAFLTRDQKYGLLTPAHGDCAVGDMRDVYNVTRSRRGADEGKAMADLRRELRKQLELCLDQLDALRNHDGVTDHRIAAVASLMDLDIFQYIRCIMQITKRGYEGINEGGA